MSDRESLLLVWCAFSETLRRDKKKRKWKNHFVPNHQLKYRSVNSVFICLYWSCLCFTRLVISWMSPLTHSRCLLITFWGECLFLFFFFFFYRHVLIHSLIVFLFCAFNFECVSFKYFFLHFFFTWRHLIKIVTLCLSLFSGKYWGPLPWLLFTNFHRFPLVSTVQTKHIIFSYLSLFCFPTEMKLEYPFSGSVLLTRVLV